MGFMSPNTQPILLEYRDCKKKYILLLLHQRKNKFELRSFASGEQLVFPFRKFQIRYGRDVSHGVVNYPGD